MLENTFEDKNILITGGAGSIGSNIVRALLSYNPRAVRVFDNNETALFDLQNELKKFKNVRFLIGDVRSSPRLKRAVENIDIVFHAAALKHVPLCEYNPFEAVETNVIGTQNVIDAAMDEEIEKLISISTDKAINPINTMGATKLLCEKLITTANYYKGRRKTVFSSVRFGNVLASSGSVIPIFKRQIEKGGPVTLTDPAMTRFFMSMNQSVKLIFKATEMAQGGEIFIFKMPTVRIVDLADVMIEELAPKAGFRKDEIKIKNIGVREGEKLHEELIAKDESSKIFETDDMYIIVPNILPSYKGPYESNSERRQTSISLKRGLRNYTSNKNTLTKEQIRRLMKKEGIL